eukprot:Skav214065  [mRNA]  locus=scaffold2017:836776:852391:+ [translate_table: standard]
MREALSTRPDATASQKANHWRVSASSYTDVLRWLDGKGTGKGDMSCQEWNPQFRCRVNAVPTWVLTLGNCRARTSWRSTSALRLSAATRRLLAELPPVVAPAPAPLKTILQTPSLHWFIDGSTPWPQEVLDLTGLGGTLLPFQVRLLRRGSKGACHPFNVKSFALNAECSKLYETLAATVEVSALHGFAVQVQNCSTVLQCSIGMLFLNAGCFLTPGYDMSARWDYWRISYWKAMVLRVQRLQRRSLRRYRSQLRSAEELRPGAERPAAEEVTIGASAVPAFTSPGPWQGQINAWKAFAEMHGHQFLLDWMGFLGMYWASATKSDDNFWLKYPFLRPGERFSPGGFAVPSEGSILDARLDDRELVNNQTRLWITSLPPPYWDSLAALNASLTKSPWTDSRAAIVWIDYDLAISPCCFDSFSFTNLIGRRQDGGLPHVVFRDSPHEDHEYVCSNSVVGRRFLEMALEKRPWPAVPYGDQSAVAESLLELLGLEAEPQHSRSGRHKQKFHL